MTDLVGRLSQLVVRNGPKWQELPEWARFLFRLGYEVGRRPAEDRRLVVAVGVPTRFLAAAAASSGVVAGRVSSENSVAQLHDHFVRLCSLKVGASVNYEYGGRLFKGEIQGQCGIAGETWLRVRIQDPEAGGETHLIQESESLRVSPAEEPDGILPMRPHGIAAVSRPAFLLSLLGHAGYHGILRATSLDCLLVGKAGLLKGELGGVRLGIHTGTRTIEEGRLNDIARTRQLIGARRTYRSFIFSSASRMHPPIAASRPRCVVFDGATGFLKWRHNWRSSHWVLFLDKTEPRCVDGATAVNDEYESRSVGIAGEFSSLRLPPAVELTAFYGPCQ